ncbi:MAG: hypothetical protein ACM35H_02535, partial [Bacteroidota bacterium]
EAVEIRVQQKLDNPEKYGVLTQDQLDLYADARLISGTKYKEARDLLTVRENGNNLLTGGRGDAATVRQFAYDVYAADTAADAAQVRGRLAQAAADGRVPTGKDTAYQQWMTHLDSKMRSLKDGEVTLNKQTTDAKKYVELRLRTTGPMAQNLKQGENDAIASVWRALEENTLSTSPRPPMQIVDEMLPHAQAQVVQPAVSTITERRRGMGMEITTDPAKAKATRDQEIKTSWQMYNTAPKGPEGDALRRTAQDRINKLRELADLEEAQAKRKAAIAESKEKSTPAGGASPGAPAPSTKPGGPLLGPKR